MSKTITHVIAGSSPPVALDIVWPPLPQAMCWFGGGWWHYDNGVLRTDFALGGIARNYFVRRRLCLLERGRIAVSGVDAFKAIPFLFLDWLKAANRSNGAELLRSGDLRTFPAPDQQFIRSKRRKRDASSCGLGPMPRCVKCAMSQSHPWKNKLRWMMAQTIVAAAVKAGIAPGPLLARAEAAMQQRGDGKQRISEFKSAAARAMRGHLNKVPCAHRTQSNGGLWCPLNGDVRQCCLELKRKLPQTGSPAPHDIWAAPAL